MKESIPVIVGAAQYTQRKGTFQPLDPLHLIAKTSQMALDDAECKGLKDIIDTLYIMNIRTLTYRDISSNLCEILEMNPSQKYYLHIGGHLPQMIVNKVSREIALGEIQAALITGGEAYYSSYLGKKRTIVLNWPRGRKPKNFFGKIPLDASSFEHKYGLLIPVRIYSLLETALRATLDRSIDEHNRIMGKNLESFSNIASKNPHSWAQKACKAEEITTSTLENRYVCLPYTKQMISNFYVDQSAALIMTSTENAEKLGIDQEKWVYPMGGADLKNIQYISQRPQLHNSPAIRECSRLALKQAGLKLNDINKFDIYSCFPCMIEIAKNEIGISQDDPRDLTITGGLPFFGGPFSVYSLHAIVTAVGLIRKDHSLKIMITANGGYNTKYSIGIYNKNGSSNSWVDNDAAVIQRSILEGALPAPIEEANGRLTIEAYTLIYDRTDKPIQGIILGHLDDGRRTLAQIDAKPEEFLKMAQKELVGQICNVHFDTKSCLNMAILTIH